MSSKNKKLLQKFRVPLGFIFAAVFLIFAKPTPTLMIIGISIAFIGLLIRSWSAGHIRKNKELAVSGPYRFTRNPLYLGSFLLGFGFMVTSGLWWLILLFIILYLGIYFPVMSVESDELTTIFGDKYKEYAAKVSMFFPWFSSYASDGKKFEKELYMRYREYQASLGFLAICGILAIKMYFL